MTRIMHYWDEPARTRTIMWRGRKGNKNVSGLTRVAFPRTLFIKRPDDSQFYVYAVSSDTKRFSRHLPIAHHPVIVTTTPRNGYSPRLACFSHVGIDGIVCLDDTASNALSEGRSPSEVFWCSRFKKMPKWFIENRESRDVILAPPAPLSIDKYFPRGFGTKLGTLGALYPATIFKRPRRER